MCLLEMRHSWTKNGFGTWITRNEINGVSLFHLSYFINLMAYLCWQRTPNVQIKYFMFDRSICRLFVLNRGRKRDSHQMMIFVNVCSTWRIVEIKTRFETCIRRNDVNGITLFHLSSLKTLIADLGWQTAPKVQIKYFVWLVDLQVICAK
jgi:hypothetical protein